MVQCIEKMQNDISPLVHQACEMWQPYDGIHAGSESPFLEWLRRACDTKIAVRCVFPDNPEKHRLIAEIRLKHLDEHCLGPAFNEEMFTYTSVSTHFEMLSPNHMIKCIEDFVQEITAGIEPG